MNALYGNLWKAFAGYIESWMFPSVLGVGFFTFALLPHVEDRRPWSTLSSLDAANGALVFAFATLGVSFALAVIARPFLRFLEGYTLRPRWLKTRWTERQKKRRAQLRQQVVQARQQNGEAYDAQEVARLRLQLDQFPRNESWVLPTRLGNALRAGETYGDSQYGLSTVGLWTRLMGVVDKKITEQLAQSSAILDFFVAMLALSMALSAMITAVAFWADESAVLLWLLLLGGLLPVWYSRAVAAVSWYAQAMQALADLGRIPLAEKLGLRLPGNLEAERKLWQAVSEYSAWGSGWGRSSDWVASIDQALVERGVQGASEEDH